MFTINQRNIWYILLFIIDLVLIYCYFNYDLVTNDKKVTGMGTIVFVSAITQASITFVVTAVTILECFNGTIQFEYKIPLPFYGKYVKYKINKEIKLRKIDLLQKAVMSLREEDEQRAERILIEYNKLEL